MSELKFDLILIKRKNIYLQKGFIISFSILLLSITFFLLSAIEPYLLKFQYFYVAAFLVSSFYLTFYFYFVVRTENIGNLLLSTDEVVIKTSNILKFKVSEVKLGFDFNSQQKEISLDKSFFNTKKLETIKNRKENVVLIKTISDIFQFEFLISKFEFKELMRVINSIEDKYKNVVVISSTANKP